MEYISNDAFRSVTNSDKGVKLRYIDNIKDELFKRHGFHTGIDLYADGVYSYASGVVTAIGKDTNTGTTYTVSVQYNPLITLRYCNLKSIDVESGQHIQQGYKIGNADRGYVRFEYCTKEKKGSVFAVRIGTETYYKHNPTELLIQR